MSGLGSPGTTFLLERRFSKPPCLAACSPLECGLPFSLFSSGCAASLVGDGGSSSLLSQLPIFWKLRRSHTLLCSPVSVLALCLLPLLVDSPLSGAWKLGMLARRVLCSTDSTLLFSLSVRRRSRPARSELAGEEPRSVTAESAGLWGRGAPAVGSTCVTVALVSWIHGPSFTAGGRSTLAYPAAPCSLLPCEIQRTLAPLCGRGLDEVGKQAGWST